MSLESRQKAQLLVEQLEQRFGNLHPPGTDPQNALEGFRDLLWGKAASDNEVASWVDKISYALLELRA